MVRVFELVTVMGEVLLNEFECPLLEKRLRYVTIKSSNIIDLVSIAHECTHTCTYATNTIHSTVEREDTTQQSLTFCHNTLNLYYSLNIYCMPSV